jgi:hypothetical protein
MSYAVSFFFLFVTTVCMALPQPFNAPIIPCNPLPGNMIGAWVWTEQTGTTSKDISGNGNTATLTEEAGYPNWNVGPFLGGLLFNSNETSSYVSCGTGMSSVTAITIAGWFYVNAYPQTGNVGSIMSFDTSGSSKFCILYINASGELAASVTATTSVSVQAGASVAFTPGVWYFGAFTYSTTASANLYLATNGFPGTPQKVASSGANGNVNISGATLSIGSDEFLPTRVFPGKVGACYVFNTALTQAQLTQLFECSSPNGIETYVAPRPATIYVDFINGNNANNGYTPTTALSNFTYAATNATTIASNGSLTGTFTSTYPITLVGTNGEVYVETNLLFNRGGNGPQAGNFYGNIGAWGTGNMAITCMSNGIIGAGICTISNYLTNYSVELFSSVMCWSNVSYMAMSNILLTGSASWFNPNSDFNIPNGLLILNQSNSYAYSIGYNIYNCGAQNCADGFVAWIMPGSSLVTSNLSYTSCWASNINIDGFATFQTVGYNQLPQTGIFPFHNVNLTNCIVSNCTGITTEYGGYAYSFEYVGGGNIVHCIGHDGGQDCYTSGSSTGGAQGIILYDTQGVTVSGCEIYNWHWGGNTSGTKIDGEAISVDQYSFGNTVQYNYFHNNDSSGLYEYAGYGGNTFRYNVCVSNCLQPSQIVIGEMCMNATSSTNDHIYGNNLIAMNYSTPYPVPALYIRAALASTNLFANNILYSTNGYAIETASDTSHTTWMSNSYSGGSSGSTIGIDWGGTVYSTPAAFASATSQDTGQITGYPQWLNGFTAPTNGVNGGLATMTNWIVAKASSPILNNALDVTTVWGLATGGQDFLGNPLVVPYDRGAVNLSQ